MMRYASSTYHVREPAQALFEIARSETRDIPKPTETNLRVIRVTGDGKCMFRSLALGLAASRNQSMSSSREETEADQLRMAVFDAMCKSTKRRMDFPEAIIAVKAESDFDRYCKRVQKPSFWGGEAELLVLSKMLKQPIGVYLPDKKHGGFRLIQEYGAKFNIENGGKRKVIKLLYNGQNHYDLLL
ncbi:hypothetical protein CYMTET_13884 [Cymbomonas tetramitiformis]|uniref:Ubiquitin thioesterase OTU n=1 Tax=Cymbomonas tetramitiformis TaxID=36881 RepID=A0AAE0LAR6_9CHLO|nr:hypothetical protein CYMTET_13884 [Cymbomonas tetramitiformis]